MNYDLEKWQTAMAFAGNSGVNALELGHGQGKPRGWFQGLALKKSNRELNVRLEERRKERTRIARDLHDTLFQGFLGVSMALQSAVESMPADSPSKPSLNRALVLMRQVIDEGRDALFGLRSPNGSSANLEQALAEFGKGLVSSGPEFRVTVMGRPKALLPEIQQEIYLVAREALVNAVRHSEATSIEAEIEYSAGKVRLIIRDNGLGMDPEILRTGKSDGHWGLQGMRERIRAVGGRLRIWSRAGAGTEVEIVVPGCVATAIKDKKQAHAPQSASA